MRIKIPVFTEASAGMYKTLVTFPPYTYTLNVLLFHSMLYEVSQLHSYLVSQ